MECAKQVSERGVGTKHCRQNMQEQSTVCWYKYTIGVATAVHFLRQIACIVSSV